MLQLVYSVSVCFIFFPSQKVFLSNYNTKLITPENTVIFDALNLPLGTCPEEARWLQEGEKKTLLPKQNIQMGLFLTKKIEMACQSFNPD